MTRPSSLWLACLLLSAGCFDFGALRPNVSGDAGGDAPSDSADPGDACAACAPFRPSFVSDPGGAREGTLRLRVRVGEIATWNTDTGSLERRLGEAVPTVESWPPFAQQIQGVTTPGLSVFRLRTLVVEEGGVLRFVGTNAAAVVVRDAVEIDGRVDVSAQAAQGGPGGASSAVDATVAALWGPSGRPGTYDAEGGKAFALSGGGGGGNGAAGGSGGEARATANGFAQGPLVALGGGGTGGAEEARTTVLVGGGAGGTGACAAGSMVRGGGGGGALLLSSHGSFRLGPLAIVSAHGAGGQSRGALTTPADCSTDLAGSAGGGGGAGGTVVLEAHVFEVAGAPGIFANGGAGAGADMRQGPIESANNGASGTDSITPVTGGAPMPSAFAYHAATAGGAGGAGALGSQPGGAAPTNNKTASALEGAPGAVAAAGGGGGAAGRILFRSDSGEVPEGIAVSPSEAPALRADLLEPLDP